MSNDPYDFDNYAIHLSGDTYDCDGPMNLGSMVFEYIPHESDARKQGKTPDDLLEEFFSYRIASEMLMGRRVDMTLYEDESDEGRYRGKSGVCSIEHDEGTTTWRWEYELFSDDEVQSRRDYEASLVYDEAVLMNEEHDELAELLALLQPNGWV
nr:hypothetical protein [Rhodococcus sp. (in: high G+C Gram-positive bacteria)]